MAGYSPSGKIDAVDLNAKCLAAFRTQLRFQDKSKLTWAELPVPGTQRQFLYIPGYSDPVEHTIPLDEYSDYFNLDIGFSNLGVDAEKIGYMAASAYNALVGHAMRKHGFGLIVTDPLVNNVKFTFVTNAEPSVADPEGLCPGWAAYRFYFGAGV